MLRVWVLTREINQYDQDGAYYMAVFANKPTVKQLKKHKLSDEEAEHVLRTGGGRLRVEHEWYFLNEVEAE